MAKQGKTSDPVSIREPWVVDTQRDVARFFSWNEANLNRYRHQGFPGSRHNYDLSAIYRWLESRKTKGTFEEDPLDLYRKEKARLATLNRLERESVLVSVENIQAVLSRLAAMLKQCGEYLERSFGPDAREAIEDVLTDFEREIFGMVKSRDV